MFNKKEERKIKPIIFGRVDSTNNIAKNTALAGADEGTLIIANSQTAGRGRLGRTFVSKKGGLYMSLVLRPKISPQNTVFITVAAAVAAARAIESVSGKKCEIKWVNDIYINGKKVCGILTEGEFGATGELCFAILGIGINLFKPKDDCFASLPLADSVFNKNRQFALQKKRIMSKKRVKREIIQSFATNFFEFYENLEKKEYIKEYAERSFLKNKEITYTKDGNIYKGVVVGIDDDANLVIDDGQRLSSGEIQIVGMEQPTI